MGPCAAYRRLSRIGDCQRHHVFSFGELSGLRWQS